MLVETSRCLPILKTSLQTGGQGLKSKVAMCVGIICLLLPERDPETFSVFLFKGHGERIKR